MSNVKEQYSSPEIQNEFFSFDCNILANSSSFTSGIEPIGDTTEIGKSGWSNDIWE